MGLRKSCKEELQILPMRHKITAKVEDERGAQEAQGGQGVWWRVTLLASPALRGSGSVYHTAGGDLSNRMIFFSWLWFLSIWLILGYVARPKLCKSMPIHTQVHKHTHLYTLRKCKLMQPRCYMSGTINWWLMSWKPSIDILSLAHSEFLGCINS